MKSVAAAILTVVVQRDSEPYLPEPRTCSHCGSYLAKLFNCAELNDAAQALLAVVPQISNKHCASVHLRNVLHITLLRQSAHGKGVSPHN